MKINCMVFCLIKENIFALKIQTTLLCTKSNTLFSCQYKSAKVIKDSFSSPILPIVFSAAHLSVYQLQQNILVATKLFLTLKCNTQEYFYYKPFPYYNQYNREVPSISPHNIQSKVVNTLFKNLILNIFHLEFNFRITHYQTKCKEYQYTVIISYPP